VLHLFQAFGIELEYALVNAATLDVAPQADWLLAEAAGEIADEFVSGPLAWNNELALHVIELKVNGPSPTLDGLDGLFQAELGKIQELLDRRGLRLMPTGMHPWMDPERELRLWPHDNREVYAAFDRIFSCKGHGWANLQSTHLNLPFDGDAEFARLHAAIRFLMPLMPALTASSPVMDGALTGNADSRLVVYRSNCARIPSVTGAVVPESIGSIADYRRQVLERIYADLAPHDPQGILAEEWVNARGAIARFDRMAIEIRVLDVQECPRMDLAFARLIVATLRALCAGTWSDLPAQRAWPTAQLARYLDETVRNAEGTDIHDRRYLGALGYAGSQATALKVWAHLAEQAAQSGALDGPSESALEHYLSHGTLSTRIRKSLPAEPGRADLERVWRELCDCLAEGRLFHARARS